MTGNQLIELIWLLFQEDLKPKNINFDDWWHTPFKADESVLDHDDLLNKLSERCGDVLADHPKVWRKAGLKPKPNRNIDPGDHCIEECRSIISAVLQKSFNPALGFRWTFAGQNQYGTAIIDSKERFKTLIDSCKELITR